MDPNKTFRALADESPGKVSAGASISAGLCLALICLCRQDGSSSRWSLLHVPQNSVCPLMISKALKPQSWGLYSGSYTCSSLVGTHFPTKHPNVWVTASVHTWMLPSITNGNSTWTWPFKKPVSLFWDFEPYTGMRDTGHWPGLSVPSSNGQHQVSRTVACPSSLPCPQA